MYSVIKTYLSLNSYVKKKKKLLVKVIERKNMDMCMRKLTDGLLSS